MSIAATQHVRLACILMLALIVVFLVWLSRLRRSDGTALLYAAWATAVGVSVYGNYYQHGASAPADIIVGVRLWNTGLFALAPVGLMIVYQFKRVERTWLFWGATAVAAAPIAGVWLGDLVISSHMREFETIAGVVLVGAEPVNSALLVVAYIAFIMVVVFHALRSGSEQIPWFHSLPIGVTLGCVLPAIVNDALFWSGAVNSLPLADFALAALAVSMFAGIIHRGGLLVAALERIVDDRTRELSASLDQLRRLIATIPDTVCVVHDGAIEFVNDAGAGFFGRPVGSLAGMPLVDLVADESRDVGADAFAALASARSATEPGVVMFVRGDGEERAGEVVGLTVALETGDRAVAIIRDVTERQRMLAKLQMSERLASVGTLAAGVAHEINNPLSYVAANLVAAQRMLLDAEPMDASELDEMLADCREGTERIAQIVRDLRAFTRTGGEATAVDVHEILQQSLALSTMQLRHRARIVTRFDSVSLVDAERGQLAQVFLNLLVNAGQAIPDGETSAHEIDVATFDGDDGNVVVEISDTGSGVAPELAQRVFDPFLTTKSVGEGTGLGLWVCHSIVAGLGGTISLAPREPRGSVARVVLPASSIAPGRRSVPRKPVRSRPARRLRVLVVDDEPQVANSTRRALPQFDVSIACSVDAALELMDRKPFDCIVCDLVMPGKTGADLHAAAKQRECSHRVVIVTAGACEPWAEQFLAGESVRWLAKPVPAEELAAEVERTATSAIRIEHVTGAA